MTAEKTDQGISESGGANCSTECSSTTPHLGTNDNNAEEENAGDASSCVKRNGDNEREKYSNSSSTVLLIIYLATKITWIYILN